MHGECFSVRCFCESLILSIDCGLVPFAFRSLNSVIRPFAQMPTGFCRRAMSVDGVGYRTH